MKPGDVSIPWDSGKSLTGHARDSDKHFEAILSETIRRLKIVEVHFFKGEVSDNVIKDR